MAFSRLRRFLPPLLLFAGLFFFGVSLLVLGTEAMEEGSRALDPSRLVVVNGTALLVYPVGYFERTDRVEVAYRFPEASGDAYFVGCNDLAALSRGEEPATPFLAFTRLPNGSFVASHQTVTTSVWAQTVDRDTGRRICIPAIAFQWDVPDGDPAPNRPGVTVLYHSARLDGETFSLLAVLMAGSALLALLGGLAWARARASAPPPAPFEDSTLEALRATLDRMGTQLERTRKHLLLAGVLGVFLWYPFLVPWAWQQAARSSDNPFIPWGVAGLTLAFLVALTVLWANEFLRLDRELTAWRGRLRELRDREAHLLDALDRGGG